MTQILMSASHEALAAALPTVGLVATVEAEFGAHLVKGTTPALTLAHHGDRAWTYREPGVKLKEHTFATEAAALEALKAGWDGGVVFQTPAPCNRLVPTEDLSAIGVSHLDLDTVGGVLALLGRKPECPGFWVLAEFVDTHGAHRVDEAGATPENIARLYGWWAWLEEHRGPRAPKDGVVDVTEWIGKAEDAIQMCVADHHDFIVAGEKFRADGLARGKRTFVERRGNVLIRVGDCFTNDLYLDPNGVPAEGVAAYNTAQGSVAISVAMPEAHPTVNCCHLVQGLWGPGAGGHPGIAGGPRDRRMTLKDLDQAADLLLAALNS